MLKFWKKSTDSDFVIDRKGVLVRYQGHGREIILPDGIKKIGAGVFSRHSDFGYSDVEKITVPEGVTEIQDNAFCASNITEITLPSTLKKIDERAFIHCRNLKSAVIPDGVREIAGSAFRNSGLEEIHLPKKLEIIGDYAFCDCRNLKKIDFPETYAPVIGNGAFVRCAGLADESGFFILQNRLFAFNEEIYGSTEEVDIPDNVIHIEGALFAHYDRINITMSLNCPSWPVDLYSGNPALAISIIEKPGSTLSFRNEEGTIAAKVILSTEGEEVDVKNDFIVSIHCKESGGFDFASYDRMFSRLERDHNRFETALVRIQYPYELREEMEEQYISYLRENGYHTGCTVIDRGDLKTLSYLEQKKVFDEEVVEELIEYAQKNEKYELLIALLDYQDKAFAEKEVYRELELMDDDAGEDSTEGSAMQEEE